MQRIPILLADAEYLVRLGLRSLIESNPQFELMDEATDEEELLDLIKTNPGKVIIMDYNQNGAFSTETVSKIKTIDPNSNLLIISADENRKNIYAVLENGVNSFITKSCGEQEITDAIKAAAKGEKFFCAKVLDYILEKSFPKNKEEASCDPVPLSAREIEVIRLISEGLIAKEIAKKLHLSTHTIYTHRKNIMKKLNLNTASELMIYAVKEGLLDPRN